MGCRTVKPVQINNEKLLEQQETLEKNINNLINEEKEKQHNLEKIQQKTKLIDESNQKAQLFIAQSEQLAKEKANAIYKKQYDDLMHEYQIYKRDLQSIIDRNTNKIREQEDELKSLQKTRAAAIAAAQKEKEIQENKDDYCLILPIEEQRDVTLLKEIQHKILKTRAIATCI